MTAMNTAHLIHGIPNMYDQKYFFPKVHAILKDLTVELKNNPHVADKSMVVTLTQYTGILDFIPSNDQELLTQAASIWLLFTSMRCIDVHAILNSYITFVPHSNKVTRMYKVLLPQTKNDKMGVLHPSQRTFCLTCHCLVDGDTDDPSFQQFIKDLKKTPDCPCIGTCPFHIIQRYLRACPVGLGPVPTKFLRALSPRGKRVLTIHPLGLNQIKNILEDMNSYLPKEIQWDTVAKGKAGRQSFTTLCVNNSVPDSITTIATKHRDPKSMRGYVEIDDGTLAKACNSIGSIIKKSRTDTDLIGGYNCPLQTNTFTEVPPLIFDQHRSLPVICNPLPSTTVPQDFFWENANQRSLVTHMSASRGPIWIPNLATHSVNSPVK